MGAISMEWTQCGCHKHQNSELTQSDMTVSVACLRSLSNVWHVFVKVAFGSRQLACPRLNDKRDCKILRMYMNSLQTTLTPKPEKLYLSLYIYIYRERERYITL